MGQMRCPTSYFRGRRVGMEGDEAGQSAPVWTQGTKRSPTSQEIPRALLRKVWQAPKVLGFFPRLDVNTYTFTKSAIASQRSVD